ncbi:MAG: hypothetical protein WA354_07855, partial [Terracidiphilus sp.]
PPTSRSGGTRFLLREPWYRQEEEQGRARAGGSLHLVAKPVSPVSRGKYIPEHSYDSATNYSSQDIQAARD